VAILTDPMRLRLYKQALSEWRYTGKIVFKVDAWSWIRKVLDDNHTQKGIAEILWKYVQSGGEIHEVDESRRLEVHDNLIRD
jgi:hypothetical protein